MGKLLFWTKKNQQWQVSDTLQDEDKIIDIYYQNKVRAFHLCEKIYIDYNLANID